MMKILLVEDDKVVSQNIVSGLKEKKIDVITATDGVTGLMKARQGVYDVLVIDRLLPRMDGLSLIRQLRALGDETPVLILTALSEIDDTVEGLESGGDDYMAKPFAFAELVARLNVLAKRGGQITEQQHLVSIGLLSIDVVKRQVKRAEKDIVLQPKEFDLLLYLALHVDEAVTRNMLLEEVWGITFSPQTNVVDVHISRLRTKMDRGFREPLIKTVRGIGYVLSANSASSAATTGD